MEIETGLLYLLFFALTVFLTSKHMDFLITKQITKRTGKKYNFTEGDIHYSFDPIAYLYSKSLMSFIKNINKNQIAIKPDYSSTLFTHPRGLNIYAIMDKKKELIGYYPFERFSCPLLDKLIRENKINQNTYSAISKYKLLQKETQDEIIDEVFGHLQRQLG